MKAYTEKLYLHSLLLFTFFTFFMPGGEVAGVNVKQLLLVVVFPLFLFTAYNSRVSVSKSVLISYCVFFVCIIFSCVVSVLSNVSIKMIALEMQVLIPLLVFPLFYIVFKGDNYAINKLLRTALFGVCLYSLVKVVLFILLFLGSIKVDQLHYISLFFGGKDPVTSPLPLGFTRIFWPKNDFFSIYLLFFFLVTFGRSSFRCLLFIVSLILVTASILIGYSRLVWAVYLFFGMVALFHLFGFKRGLFYATVASLFFIIIIMFSFGWEFIENRFSAEYLGDSDNTRILQVESMIRSIQTNFLFGTGIGSSSDYIRFEHAPFSYEVWMLSFIMKLGFLGSLSLGVLFTVYSLKTLVSGSIRSVLLLVSVMVLLSASFSNQYLPSSITGVLFGLLVLLHGRFEGRGRVRHQGNAGI